MSQPGWDSGARAYYPGARYLDWDLPDPAGQPVAAVRPIIDDIDQRVQHLLAELDPNIPG